MKYSSLSRKMDSCMKLTSKVDEITEDLEYWMSNLPNQLKTLSIIHLAVPGSHNSMTWSIHPNSDIGPPAEPFLKGIKTMGPLWRATMYRWSITQSYDVLAQLKAGIRYFDFKTATKYGTDDIFFVNGLYADEVKTALMQIQSFVVTHPQEVVLLDFRYFCGFRLSDHNRFMFFFTTTFKDTLVPFAYDMVGITLDFMNRSRYQVIIIYRNEVAQFNQPLLWPSCFWPVPQPGTYSISHLINFLDEKLKSRELSKGFISQCLVNPTSCFVCKHMFGSLKSTCAIPLEKHTLNWIKAQQPGSGGANIIMADFIDTAELKFSKAVIGLNAKLLIDSNWRI